MWLFAIYVSRDHGGKNLCSEGRPWYIYIYIVYYTYTLSGLYDIIICMSCICAIWHLSREGILKRIRDHEVLCLKRSSPKSQVPRFSSHFDAILSVLRSWTARIKCDRWTCATKPGLGQVLDLMQGLELGHAPPVLAAVHVPMSPGRRWIERRGRKRGLSSTDRVGRSVVIGFVTGFGALEMIITWVSMDNTVRCSN